jgi:hypothetical protein
LIWISLLSLIILLLTNRILESVFKFAMNCKDRNFPEHKKGRQSFIDKTNFEMKTIKQSNNVLLPDYRRSKLAPESDSKVPRGEKTIQ